MPKFAANLSLMFTEHAFLDRFRAAADAGFEAVEFLFPYDYEPSVLKQRLTDNELKLVLFNLYPGEWEKGARGLAAVKGQEARFRTAAQQAVDYARALGCRQLHAMAGLNSDGVDRATYIANLKIACELAGAQGITILIEPINTHDMPGYFLTDTEDALDVIESVAAPNIALQFDLYHRHKMQGGVLKAIDRFASVTQHYQCAAPRDRGEPDRQDLDYRDVFKAIDATGFAGWIGCEYRPRGETHAGLSWRTELGV